MSAAYRPCRNGLNRTGRPTHEAVLPSDLVLVLGVSERHVRRILAAYRREGSASAHSSRRLPTARWSTWTVNSRCRTGGRPSPRRRRRRVPVFIVLTVELSDMVPTPSVGSMAWATVLTASLPSSSRLTLTRRTAPRGVGNRRARRGTTSPLRKHTPRQQALWNAVQQAKLKGHFR